MSVNLNSKNVKTLRKQIVKFYLDARPSLDGRKQTKFDNLLIHSQPQKGKLEKTYYEIVDLLQSKGKLTKEKKPKKLSNKQLLKEINVEAEVYNSLNLSNKEGQEKRLLKKQVNIEPEFLNSLLKSDKIGQEKRKQKNDKTRVYADITLKTKEIEAVYGGKPIVNYWNNLKEPFVKVVDENINTLNKVILGSLSNLEKKTKSLVKKQVKLVDYETEQEKLQMKADGITPQIYFEPFEQFILTGDNIKEFIKFVNK